MRHKIDRRKLGLPSDQRRALLTNLCRQLIRVGYVHTTLGRAKELRRLADRLITLGKDDTLAARRQARKVLVGHSSSTPVSARAVRGMTDIEKLQYQQRHSLLNGEDLVLHLFLNLAPRYAKRQAVTPA